MGRGPWREISGRQFIKCQQCSNCTHHRRSDTWLLTTSPSVLTCHKAPPGVFPSSVITTFMLPFSFHLSCLDAGLACLYNVTAFFSLLFFFFDLSVFKRVRVTFNNKMESQKLFFLRCAKKENKLGKKGLNTAILILPVLSRKAGELISSCCLLFASLFWV